MPIHYKCHRLIFLLPALLWGSVIIWGSLASPLQLPASSLLSFDKVIHVGIYFVFSVLLFYGIIKQGASLNKRQHISLITILIASLLGLSMEVLQYTGNAGRSFEMLDILANIIGSLLGVAAVSLIH